MKIAAKSGPPDESVQSCATACRIVVTILKCAAKEIVSLTIGDASDKAAADAKGIVTFTITEFEEADAESVFDSKHPKFAKTLKTKATLSLKKNTKLDKVLQCACPAVAIVGAGAAGLKAACDLLAAGCSVTMIEARDRIGGRAWTDTSLGVPFDKGCQWLHDDPWAKEAKSLKGFDCYDELLENFLIEGDKIDVDKMDKLESLGGDIENLLHCWGEDLLAKDVLGDKLDAVLQKYAESEATVDDSEVDKVLKEHRDKLIDEEVDKTFADIKVNQDELEKAIHVLHDRKLRLELKGNYKTEGKSTFEKEKRTRDKEFTDAATKNIQRKKAREAAEQKITPESVKQQSGGAVRKDLLADAVKEKVSNAKDSLKSSAKLLTMATTRIGAMDESIEFDQMSVVDLALRPHSDARQTVCVKGYGALIAEYGKQLATSYPCLTTLLKAEVKKVSYADSRVTVTTTEAQTFDRAIVTVPTGVINAKKIAFDPELPSDFSAAFAKLPMGHFKKIALQFDVDVYDGVTKLTKRKESDKKRPEEDLRELVVWPYTEDATNMIKLLTHRGKGRCNVLLCIVGGALAKKLDDEKDEKKVVEYILPLIVKPLPFLDNKIPTAAAMSAWSVDPYSLGAYSYTALGGKGKRKFLAENALQDASKNPLVFFAGEALWYKHYGTAHGAYSSGIDAAKRVLATLQ